MPDSPPTTEGGRELQEMREALERAAQHGDPTVAPEVARWALDEINRRYTLPEAERELALRECVMQGHYYEVNVRMGENRPATVLCSRCGESWAMASD